MSQQRIISALVSGLIYVLPFMRNKDQDSQVNAVSIVAVNFLILLGVILGGWNVFLLLFIYWIETVALGLFTLLKMTISGWRDRKSVSDVFAIFFFDGFFVFHFGMFMAVHLAFLTLFQILSRTGATSSSVFEREFNNIMHALGLRGEVGFLTNLVIEHPIELAAVLALVIRLAFDFYYFHLKEIDKEKFRPEKIMIEPYGRVVHMHISIIFGGFALMAARFSGVFFAVAWVLLKTFLELKGPIQLGKSRAKNKVGSES